MSNAEVVTTRVVKEGHKKSITEGRIASSVCNAFRSIKLAEKREQLQQRIEHTSSRIDQLVYRLYGLNEEEISLIESAR